MYENIFNFGPNINYYVSARPGPDATISVNSHGDL